MDFKFKTNIKLTWQESIGAIFYLALVMLWDALAWFSFWSADYIGTTIAIALSIIDFIWLVKLIEEALERGQKGRRIK